MQLISSSEYQFARRNHLITTKVTKTKGNHIYVDDFVAMNIWNSLNIHSRRCKKLEEEAMIWKQVV